MYLYKKSFLFGLVLLVCTGLTAQIRIGNQFQSELVQRSAWNPAAMQDVAVQVSLSSIQPFVGGNSFTLNDIFREVPGTDSLEITLDQLLNKLEPTNVLRADLELDIFGLAIGSEKLGLQVGFNVGVKGHSQIGFDDELLDVLVNGNAQFIGERVELGPQVSMMAYTDVGISAAKRIGKILTLGARLRYLNGIMGVNTATHMAKLFTSSEYYQIEMDLDYELQSSFPELGVLDSIGVGNINEIGLMAGPNFTNNHGFALDFSAILSPTKNLELSAGVQGLGSINWRKNAQSYVSMGTFRFEGVEPKDDEDRPLIEQLVDLDFTGLADTILNTFSFESEEKDFSMAIPRRYFISGMYSPLDLLQLGASYQLEFFGGLSHTTMGLYGGLKLGHGFSFGLTYGNDSNFGSFMGVHSHLNLGPLQLYSSIDNVNSIFNPLGSRAYTMRGGVNLLFGKRWKKRNKKEKMKTIQTDL